MKPKGRKKQPRSKFNLGPENEVLVRTFDQPTDDEIAAISAEIGATGARRPASE
jgi:hypothetical protein